MDSTAAADTFHWVSHLAYVKSLLLWHVKAFVKSGVYCNQELQCYCWTIVKHFEKFIDNYCSNQN